jgi:hypothetical protein
MVRFSALYACRVRRRRLLLAALLVAGGAATLALVVSRVGGNDSATQPKRLTVTINAPATTPPWLLRLVRRKAREITRTAPTTGVIEKRGSRYEVRLDGDFTWLACGACTESGPLPVHIEYSAVFQVDPALRRVVMAKGPPSLLR